VVTTVVVPLALATIALLDGALAGFRAATGRNGMIVKRAFYATAVRRGFLSSVAMLSLLSLVLLVELVVAEHPSTRYETLVRAGLGLLVVIVPYAAVVVASLVGYAVLPRRPATFLILLGLGPLTLIRPYLTVAAGILGVWWSRDLIAGTSVALAVIGVLAIEPCVHRRWYATVA
jgi:hypothetical protein